MNKLAIVIAIEKEKWHMKLWFDRHQTHTCNDGEVVNKERGVVHNHSGARNFGTKDPVSVGALVVKVRVLRRNCIATAVLVRKWYLF